MDKINIIAVYGVNFTDWIDIPDYFALCLSQGNSADLIFSLRAPEKYS
jgi:hypothetical protein